MCCIQKKIVLTATPLEETAGDGLKKEVLILLEGITLAKFGKDEVTEDDYTEAKELKLERIKEEEEKRRQEELDRLAALEEEQDK